MMKKAAAIAIFLCLGGNVAAQEARDIVKGAIDHWRGTSSYSEMTMTIHRPDWERSMTMRGWTEGEKKSLVRIMAPARDKNNGTLMIDNNMWTFSPKVNRVIKVPSSMMNQSWMGSDFSNKDISRSDDIVDQYDHQLLGQNEMDDHTVFEIESIPHEEAAVVWGREVLRIRDDYVVLDQRFYDQDDVLVKTLVSIEIGEVGGRVIAKRQRMGKEETPDEWTEIYISSAEYDIDLSESLFTLSNLRNPRD